MTVIVEINSSDLPGTNARWECRSCGHIVSLFDKGNGYLARYIQADGRTVIRWVCNNCEDYGTAGALPQSILPADVTVDDLPICADRRDEDLPEYEPCCVCEAVPTQQHHWAPQAIFPDWPHLTAPLCLAHHDEWHNRMRAHGLRWPRELAEAW